MAVALWHTASSNAFNTTLNGNVAIGDNSITLTSVIGLSTLGGVLTLDRQDLNGNDTPTLREYISYTGISSNTVIGVIRGLGGSNAQSHTSGAKVEETFTTTHWNDLLSALTNVLTSAGVVDATKVVDLTSSQTLTNKILTAPTITNPTISGGGSMAGTFTGTPTYSGAVAFTGKPTFTATSPTLVADTDGATITFDMNAGNIHSVTLGGNRVLAVTNVAVGQVFIIRLLQDGGGTRTVTWFNTIKWTGGTTPTLTTTINKADSFGFFCTSTGNYDGYIIGQNI